MVCKLVCYEIWFYADVEICDRHLSYFYADPFLRYMFVELKVLLLLFRIGEKIYGYDHGR